MPPNTHRTRGGLTYADRLDFTRGAPLTVHKRRLWPSVTLQADRETLTLTSGRFSDTLHQTAVTALPHQPFYGRYPTPAFAVSLEIENRNEVLLFWTPEVRTLIKKLAALGWNAEEIYS